MHLVSYYHTRSDFMEEVYKSLFTIPEALQGPLEVRLIVKQS